MSNNTTCEKCSSNRVLLASAYARNPMVRCLDCGHKQVENVSLFDRSDETALRDNERG